MAGASVGSFSNSRSVDEVHSGRARLDALRAGASFRKAFLGRYGPEIEAEWRRVGREYQDKRREVYAPSDPDEALIFGILCVYTYRLYEHEPWGLMSDGTMRFDFTFPPMQEVVDLAHEHLEEWRLTEVKPPSYIMQVTGLYNILYGGDDGF